MKRLVFLMILLICGVATAIEWPRIARYICDQNLTDEQVANLSWRQLETQAENRGVDPNDIKPFYRTIINSVRSDRRKKNAEAVRSGTETVVRQYRPGTNVITIGIERSIIDPNSTVMVFRMEVPL